MYYDNTLEGFDRTDRLNWLNKDIGKLGQFYVNCKGCGRKKIIQEQIHRPLRYRSFGADSCPIQNNYLRENKDSSRYCVQDCVRDYVQDCSDNIGRDTVSLWNDDYIDTDQIFCYNCALDLKTKVLQEAKTYRELPASNGPPGYSVYLDASYR